MSNKDMASRIAVIRHHSANQREELEGLFPVAYELIQRALAVVKDAEDETPHDVARRGRDTFKDRTKGSCC